MTPLPMTAKEKLEHIISCPENGCVICKMMTYDVLDAITELEKENARLRSVVNGGP